MRALVILWSLSVALLVGGAAAGQYYVNGVSGLDLPERGQSAAAPWKTLSYALGQMPAPAAGTQHTLFVAGGQTYSATTNGEVFPLQPRFELAIVGVGLRPVLEGRLKLDRNLGRR